MRTIVVCKCKAKLRRRDGDVKLVEHVAVSCDGVLELSGGLRWVREGPTCIIETTLAGFTAQPKGVFFPPRARELFHFSEHVFQRLWSEHDVFQCATCDGANTLPKWQREPTGFALLAGDEGDPFAQEDQLGESEEVHNSKREPTHRGEVVRRAPVEPFGAGK